MTKHFTQFAQGVSGSYSQIFFTNNRWLALFVSLASFSHPVIGLSGLACVMLALALGMRLGLNQVMLSNGTFTYNVLLSGFALAVLAKDTQTLVLYLPLVSVTSLFITVWLYSWFGRYRLPILSLPFILSIWLLLLSSNGLHQLFERECVLGRYSYPYSFIDSSTEQTLALLPVWLKQYFLSMSTILFQKNMLAGVLVSTGLLIYSRIAFGLSLTSFLSGYWIYLQIKGVHTPEFSAFGFNFIFTAVSLCGFFLIPSRNSYLLAILSAPFLWLCITACESAFSVTKLPVFSLSFSVLVLIVLSVLNNRSIAKHFILVQYQQYSPEKNLYAYHTYMERFRKDTFIHIHLPVFGEWCISQGHTGDKTHKQDWQYAWDFVVKDEFKRSFKAPGEQVGDFYCYGLPVIAPADGYVAHITDGIDDNPVGDANLQENWGNTLVIKHSDTLFSKLSHLKKDSFKVKQGDYVRKGDVLAQCGNSGRSPEPHLHFQLQNNAAVGSKTLQYPISYYILKHQEGYTLKSFDIPKEHETILRPVTLRLLKKAFHFIPGMKLRLLWTEDAKEKAEVWEVFTDAYNASYFYCEADQSVAYFTNNGTLFYFTAFSGNKGGMLYQFYLSAYKVLLSYYPGLEIKDTLPVDTTMNLAQQLVQDLIAPFKILVQPIYKSSLHPTPLKPVEERLVMKSSVVTGKDTVVNESEMLIADKGIEGLRIKKRNQWIDVKVLS